MGPHWSALAGVSPPGASPPGASPPPGPLASNPFKTGRQGDQNEMQLTTLSTVSGV